jgi:hypothetical protein
MAVEDLDDGAVEALGVDMAEVQVWNASVLPVVIGNLIREVFLAKR